MTESAYRSTDDAVMDALADAELRYSDWHARVGVFSVRFPDHKVLKTDSGRSAWVCGLVGDTKPGPGWRKGSRAGWECWVPDKRTKPGKELAAEIAALEVKRLGTLPGMPIDVFHGSTCYRPGVHLWNGIIWVNWGCSAEVVEGEGGGVDAQKWHRAKLSEFYAAKEEVEEQAAMEDDDDA